MKKLLLCALFCASLHAMEELPEFVPHNPAEDYRLGDRARIEFSSFDFAGDQAACFITLCPEGAVRPTLAGAPPRRYRRNGDQHVARIAVEQMPIELLGQSDEPIVAFDVYRETNRAFIVCRTDGSCTLFNLTDPDEPHFTPLGVRIEENIRACYFSSRQTARIICNSGVYEWNFTTGTLTHSARSFDVPERRQDAIIVAQPRHDAGAAARPAVVAAPRQRRTRGCWDLLLFLFFKRPLYGRTRGPVG